jgi:multimeric flavodoxin WrbA
MKAVGINGSPRKKWNTATLLDKALQGAASQGAETESFHLYDLTYKGCVSCFSCKTKDGRNYGRCAVQDDLTPILKKIEEVDILILASPIYFGTVTGEMRSFMERLLFPYMTYTDPPGSLFSGKLRTCFIYTLGATEELAKERGFDRHIATNEMLLRLIFGHSVTQCSFDTYQFEDYSKVYAPRWDPEQKARRRSEAFPVDCQHAFDLGSQLAGG